MGSVLATKSGSKSAVIALFFSAAIHLSIVFLADTRATHTLGWDRSLSVSFSAARADTPTEVEAPKSMSLHSSPDAEAPRLPRNHPLSGQEIFTKHPRQPDFPEKSRYLKNNEVDERAAPLDRPNIIYPEQAFNSKISGKVRVRVFIGYDGRVDTVYVEASEPKFSEFEKIAINALKDTLYSPAILHGQPVSSQQVVEVVFNPHEDVAADHALQRPSGSSN